MYPSLSLSDFIFFYMTKYINTDFVYANFILKQPEYQQLMVDAGALHCLVDLLKRHKSGSICQAFTGLLRRAADAITNLAHENISIKTLVRLFFVSIP